MIVHLVVVAVVVLVDIATVVLQLDFKCGGGGPLRISLMEVHSPTHSPGYTCPIKRGLICIAQFEDEGITGFSLAFQY
jgi:hypothetical protein